MAVRPAVPTRSTSGVQSDPPYGPLANSGMTNPFFYHQSADDFDYLDTQRWTVTSDSTGTVASAAGDGGTILFTTAATAADYESIHGATASWVLSSGAPNAARMFFLTRLQLSDITASGVIIGLTNSTGVPTAVTDGVYFTKPSGATVINLVYNVGGTAVTTPLPASAYALANASYIDLAWEITSTGDLRAYAGAQLVGWIPQSGTGGVNSAGVPLLPVLGPCLTIPSPVLSTANLVQFASLTASAAAAKTMTVDFIATQKQR